MVGRGSNRVVAEGDPPLHAEVVAIRDACRSLGSHHLTGAVQYASCEPGPMCFGAAWWARVDRIVHARDRPAAGRAGPRPFAAWQANPDRVPY